MKTAHKHEVSGGSVVSRVTIEVDVVGWNPVTDIILVLLNEPGRLCANVSWRDSMNIVGIPTRVRDENEGTYRGMRRSDAYDQALFRRSLTRPVKPHRS